MMEDIVGDYKDKTVTLEDFPFFDASQAIKMASVHPCKHASVMKVLLDRADAALKLRKERLQRGGSSRPALGMEGLVDDMAKTNISSGHRAGVALAGGNGGDEWEVLEGEGAVEDDSAIRVDQYLVVFLKVRVVTLHHDASANIWFFASSWRASRRASSTTLPWAYKERHLVCRWSRLYTLEDRRPPEIRRTPSDGANSQSRIPHAAGRQIDHSTIPDTP